MILFFDAHGRLGNQLFHLAALDTLCADREVGVLFGSALVCDHFRLRRRNIFVTRHRPERVLRAVRKLAHHGLASHRIEQRLGTAHGIIEAGELTTLKNSRMPLTLVENSWLQSDIWMRPDFPQRLEFSKNTLAEVTRFAAENSIDWATTIFVHVRRGDYVDLGVTLPVAYYSEGVQRLESKLPVSATIFVSDDAEHVSSGYPHVGRKLVVSRAQIFDLCVMSRCASGVLSASSFSWWGAMLGPMRVPPVAPQGWVGWRRHITFPARILSPRFDAIPVPTDDGP